MERPKFVYWMPTNEPTFIMPLHQMQVAGVIKVVRGQLSDRELYYSFLADRVQEMIDATVDRDGAVAYTFEILEEVGLVREMPASVKLAGRHFVSDNLDLQEHLHLAGIPGSLPNLFAETDLEAEKIYNESDLESWFSAATWGR